MKLKKIAGGCHCGGSAVSTMAVTSFTASAAAVSSVPKGTENVLYTVGLTDKNTATGAWSQLGSGVQVSIDDTTIMTNENVYAKLIVNSFGDYVDENGNSTSAKDVLGWSWDSYSWITGVKWYNNYSDSTDTEKDHVSGKNGEFDVNFIPFLDGDKIVSYVPISDFTLDQYNQIGGNLQNGHFASVTVESLEIVEFTTGSGSEDIYDWSLTVDPDTVTLAVDETEKLAYKAEVTDKDGNVVNTYPKDVYDEDEVPLTIVWASSDDAVATVDENGTVTAVAKGEAEITATYTNAEIFGEADPDLVGVCAVTVTDGDEGDVEIPAGKKITLENNSWGAGGPENSNWQGTESVTIDGIVNWTTTAAEAMEKLDSLEFSFPVNGAICNGKEFDVSKLGFQGVLQTKDGCWKTFDGSVSNGKVTISIPDVDSALSGYTAEVNIAVCINTAYANSSADIDVYIGDITVKNGSDEPAPPADPDGEVLFSGSATANTSVSGSKVAKYKDTAVITVTYMPAASEEAFIEAAKITADEMSYPANTGTIAGQLDADPWWCQPNDSAYWTIASSDAFGKEQTFTITVADYLASINQKDMPFELVFCPWNGTTITKVTIKGDLKSSGSDDPKPNEPNEPNKPDVPDNNTVVYTPVINNTVAPYGYTPATDEEIANTVSSTAEGDTASVNLTSGTRVEKAVFDTIAGKDINVEFKLRGGVRWIINGKNVEKAKKVDLGVRLRSKAIPEEKVSAVAGDNRTVQFSLRHNGDLGFTGALIIPFSSAYNGKFANLYYYNKAKDDLEFVGSSKISAGQASFVFTHASDYVVVIDDEAYGEDVSSAAGVYETSEETAAPYAAVAVIAVLGAAAVVIKKRLAK